MDARLSRRPNTPPRPYLSDLAVRKDWRGRGVGTALVRECETKALEMGDWQLYLRVDRDNDAALAMYDKRDYERMDHPYFGVKDNTILLRGNLATATAATTVAGAGEDDGSDPSAYVVCRVLR